MVNFSESSSGSAEMMKTARGDLFRLGLGELQRLNRDQTPVSLELKSA